jgi:hypothetical protein
MTTAVWTRGQKPPADLPSGDYIFTFFGNYTLARGAAVLLKAAIGRTISYPGGHSVTINRVDLVRAANEYAILSVVVTLVGIAWALPLAAIAGLLGIAIFTFLSLTSVVKLTQTVAGSMSVAAGAVALLGVVGFTLWKLKDKI